MRYPVTIEKVDGSYVVSISHPDGRFQGACEASTRDKALAETHGLIAAMITDSMASGEIVPEPSRCERGNGWVYMHPLLAAKASIYNEMRVSKKRKADIARAMGVNQKQVDRILNPKHHSTLDQLQSAAASLGKHLDLRLA